MFVAKRHTAGLIYRPSQPTIPQPSDTERKSFSRGVMRNMSK